MESFVELNETLRISKEQGFPIELEYKKRNPRIHRVSFNLFSNFPNFLL